jgi:hypothetical protein
MTEITRLVSAESRVIAAVNSAADRVEAMAGETLDAALERLRSAASAAGARIVEARTTLGCVLRTLADAFGDLSYDIEEDLDMASRPALPPAERRLAELTERDRAAPPALEWPAVEAAPEVPQGPTSAEPEAEPAVEPGTAPEVPEPQPAAPSDPDGPDPLAAEADPAALERLKAREARLDALLGELEEPVAAAVPAPEPSGNGKRGGKRGKKS